MKRRWIADVPGQRWRRASCYSTPHYPSNWDDLSSDRYRSDGQRWNAGSASARSSAGTDL